MKLSNYKIYLQNKIKNILSHVILSIMGFILFPYTVISIYRFKNKEKVKKMLIIATNQGLGNLVLMTPMLKKIREIFPAVKIAVLVDKKTAMDFLYSQKIVDQVMLFNINKVNFSQGLSYFLREIKPKKFSLSIFAYSGDFFYYSIWPLLAGIGWRIVGCRGKQAVSLQRFVNTFVLRWESNQHEVIQYLKLIEPLVREKDYNPECNLLISQSAAKFANGYFKTNNLTADALVLGLHPGSARSDKWKRYPLEKFLQAAKEYKRFYNGNVIFFIGSEEAEFIPRIRSADSNFLVFYDSNIENVIALIKKCCVFLGNDSSLMHIANFLAVPVVAVFGPTIPKKNAPWNGGYRIVRKDLPCSPCYQFSTVNCNQRSCLEKITVEEVFAALQELTAVIRRETLLPKQIQGQNVGD